MKHDLSDLQVIDDEPSDQDSNGEVGDEDKENIDDEDMAKPPKAAVNKRAI